MVQAEVLGMGQGTTFYLKQLGSEMLDCRKS
jgi:hypothetical protein